MRWTRKLVNKNYGLRPTNLGPNATKGPKGGKHRRNPKR